MPKSDEGVLLEFSGYGGIRLVGERRGDENSPIVLLLHGGGQTRHAWSNAAKSIASAGFCAITLDARGHGDSQWAPEGDYSIDALVEDLSGVIKQLGGVHSVVGASMGGITAMVAVGENKVQPVDRLVLVDIAPRVESEGVRKIIHFMSSNLNGFASLEEARAAVAAYNPHRPPQSDTSGLRKNLRRREDGRFYWHWDPQFLDYATRSDAGEALSRLERRMSAARGVRIPTLLVRGAGSDVVSSECVRELLELIPQANVVDIAGAGHMVAGDRNDVFATAVLSFLKPELPV